MKAILPEVLFLELPAFVHHLLVFLWIAEPLCSSLVDLPKLNRLFIDSHQPRQLNILLVFVCVALWAYADTKIVFVTYKLSFGTVALGLVWVM